MTEAKRQELKGKVEAAQARNNDRGRTTMADRAGERAIEAKDKFAAFARAHPIATVAGGLALGILVSSLFKRSPTRKVASRAAGKAATLAALGAELALAYAQQARTAAGEAGRAGAHKLEDLGDTLGDTARSLRREATHRAGNLADGARIARRETVKSVGRAIRGRMS